MLDAWIIGIVGVICLGVLLEIVLPEGQTGKYVKGAFSLLVIFVIVAPLPSVAGALKNWAPEYADIQPDYGFIDETVADFENETASAIESMLAEKGYESEVKVAVKEGSLSEIDKIEVILYLAVLSDEEKNRHIASVVGLVAESAHASADKVYVTVLAPED